AGVRVDRSPPVRTVHRIALDIFDERSFRSDDRDSRELESGWTLATMSVETAEPLQQYVDRTEVGHHEVEIHVETLLHDLRGYQDHSSGRRTRTEICQHPPVESFAIWLGVPRVIRRPERAALWPPQEMFGAHF